ncbi:MAG: hypothetical protein Q7I97_05220 [Thermovirgaceae bacterium]|nr:hypothetical protein [Thermovirgaceae bacterium]
MRAEKPVIPRSETNREAYPLLAQVDGVVFTAAKERQERFYAKLVRDHHKVFHGKGKTIDL